MFRHPNCKGNCGSKSCTEWMLARLGTVSAEISVLEAEGLSIDQIVDLTGLEKDASMGWDHQFTYRGGYAFAA